MWGKSLCVERPYVRVEVCGDFAAVLEEEECEMSRGCIHEGQDVTVPLTGGWIDGAAGVGADVGSDAVVVVGGQGVR